MIIVKLPLLLANSSTVNRFDMGQLNAVKGKRCLHHGSPFASVIQFNVLNVNQALLLLSSLNKAGLVERSSGQMVLALWEPLYFKSLTPIPVN